MSETEEVKQLLAELLERSDLQSYAVDGDLRGDRWRYSDTGEHDKAVRLLARIRAVLSEG